MCHRRKTASRDKTACRAHKERGTAERQRHSTETLFAQTGKRATIMMENHTRINVKLWTLNDELRAELLGGGRSLRAAASSCVRAHAHFLLAVMGSRRRPREN